MNKWIESEEVIDGKQVVVRWLNKGNNGNFDNNMPRIDRVFPCSWCNKYFEVQTPYKVKQIKKREDNRVFCSKSCRQEWYSKEWSQTSEWKDESKVRAVNILENGLIEKTFTEPQIIVDDLLIQKGINYENEYNCKYHSIDNYLTDYNLMIEVMGTYWHCDHRIYPHIIYQNQWDQIIKDKRKNSYVINNHNVNILYLWEHDIANNIDLVDKLIDLYINEKGSLFDYHSFNYFIFDDEIYLDNNLDIPYFEMNETERGKYREFRIKGKSRKQEDKWITFNCEHCGKEVEQLKTRYRKSKSHYCSQECKKAVGQSKHNCDNCGKEMVLPKYRIDDLNNGVRQSICCSEECSSEYRSKHYHGKNHVQYNRVEKTCEQCGDTYEVVPHLADSRRFCSRDCMYKHRKNN